MRDWIRYRDPNRGGCNRCWKGDRKRSIRRSPYRDVRRATSCGEAVHQLRQFCIDHVHGGSEHHEVRSPVPEEACSTIFAMRRKLNHPNLVKFIGYVSNHTDRRLWLLTEFIPGGSLRRFCHSDPSLPFGDKLKIAIGCWSGLAYLHSRKCCHKDISPNNILVRTHLVDRV